ncbi:MAG: adenosylmethionine-8-amino-7-oxononanoate aminotransferase, partial [Gammaproteobacteria bacterium]
MSQTDWQIFDQQHVWHPYTSVPASQSPLPVASANGVRLTLVDGTELIDAMSSWWSAIHGYNHEVLNQALLSQSQKMSHVMFGGLTHEPAATLCKRLVELTPDGLEKVFLSDSGSIAIEVAMKMACQYWQGRGKPTRTRFISLSRGYHGDTIGAMSVSDPSNGMHHLFTDLLQQQIYLPAPPCRFDQAHNPALLMEFERIIEQHRHETAAIVLEPIVQGAGGMRMYHSEVLQGIREIADQFEILLIADEIATGFGRTGKMFACEHAGISPDILCAGKAMTAGMMTLAATLCTEDVALGIAGSAAGVFMHGPTYMGNPLACAVANASIDLLNTSDWQSKISAIEAQLRHELEPARSLSGVEDVRVMGAIGVIEMCNPVDMAAVND